MNESETRAEHIDPALKAAGWGVLEGSRILREHAKAQTHQHFSDRQQVFLDFVLAQYVTQGVDELDTEKLTPLLRLKYHNAISDAVADLGGTAQIRWMFAGFQKYLYAGDGGRSTGLA